MVSFRRPYFSGSVGDWTVTGFPLCYIVLPVFNGCSCCSSRMSPEVPRTRLGNVLRLREHKEGTTQKNGERKRCVVSMVM